MKWIEWKKREYFDTYVLEINCRPAEYNNYSGAVRAIIEAKLLLRQKNFNVPTDFKYYLYVGKIPEFFLCYGKFIDNIRSIVASIERRKFQMKILPIDKISEIDKSKLWKAYNFAIDNPNSAQYQINQYISQLEEEDKNETSHFYL